MKVRVIPAKAARQVITAYHYSRAWPTGNFVSFGVFVEGDLLGVCTFGHPANNRNWKSIPGCEKNRDLSELTRLWIADRAPKMLESQTIATCLRILRREQTCKVVVSYADPMQGHTGTVYQASNWVFVGQMKPCDKLMWSDGSLMHKRAAFDRYGTNQLAKLRHIDPNVKSIRVPGKYKYLYPIDKRLLPTLRRLAKPYPCASPSERGLGDQPRKGGADPTLALHFSRGDE